MAFHQIPTVRIAGVAYALLDGTMLVSSPIVDGKTGPVIDGPEDDPVLGGQWVECDTPENDAALAFHHTQAYRVLRASDVTSENAQQRLDASYLEAAVEGAINTMAKMIQAYLGVTTGDFAAQFFADNVIVDDLTSLADEYLQAELLRGGK